MVKRTTEEKQNPAEQDVRDRVKELSSPILQQEYLENLLKRIVIQPNVRILASRLLADIYARQGMWANASRALESAADATTTFEDRKNLFMNVGILQIKAQDYISADDSFRKAIEAASSSEKARLQQESRNLFMSEAETLDRQGKAAKSVKLYERLLRSSTITSEKKKIMERLMANYEKLGKVQDALSMRESLKNL